MFWIIIDPWLSPALKNITYKAAIVPERLVAVTVTMLTDELLLLSWVFVFLLSLILGKICEFEWF